MGNSIKTTSIDMGPNGMKIKIGKNSIDMGPNGMKVKIGEDLIDMDENGIKVNGKIISTNHRKQIIQRSNGCIYEIDFENDEIKSLKETNCSQTYKEYLKFKKSNK